MKKIILQKSKLSMEFKVLMGLVMKDVSGRIEGRKVSELIKEHLKNE